MYLLIKVDCDECMPVIIDHTHVSQECTNVNEQKTIHGTYMYVYNTVMMVCYSLITIMKTQHGQLSVAI